MAWATLSDKKVDLNHPSLVPVHIKTQSDRKSNNFKFEWTTILPNSFMYIKTLLHIT